MIDLPPGLRFTVIYIRLSGRFKYEGTPVIGVQCAESLSLMDGVKTSATEIIQFREYLAEFMSSPKAFFEIDDLNMFTQSDKSHMYISTEFLNHPARVNPEKLKEIDYI